MVGSPGQIFIGPYHRNCEMRRVLSFSCHSLLLNRPSQRHFQLHSFRLLNANAEANCNVSSLGIVAVSIRLPLYLIPQRNIPPLPRTFEGELYTRIAFYMDQLESRFRRRPHNAKITDLGRRLSLPYLCQPVAASLLGVSGLR